MKKIILSLTCSFLILCIITGCGITNSSINEEDSNPNISENWKDFDVKIDGIKYLYPYSLKKLNEHGYEFDISNNFEIEANGKYSPFSSLRMEKWTKKTENNTYSSVSIATIINKTNKKVTDIYKCYATAITFNGSSLGNVEVMPNVVIAKNITMGSSKDEIINAFGEPKNYDPVSSERTWYEYSDYQMDGNDEIVYIMDLLVDNEKGLINIKLEKYTK